MDTDTTARVEEEETEFLQAAEVARILHVSPKTVSRWADERRLPHTRTLGGHRRFPARAIRDIAGRMVQGEEPARS